MKCAQCRELLFDYIEGLIDDRQNRDITSHLAACAACRREEQSLRSLQRNLIQNGQAMGQVDLENEVLGRIVREQKSRFQTEKPSTIHLSLRSQLMKSPLSRCAAAAIIVITLGLGLQLLRNTGNVSLASVLEHLNNVLAYTCLVSSDDALNETRMWVSKEYGKKEITTTTDPDTGQSRTEEFYANPKEILWINHQDKTYRRSEITDTLRKLGKNAGDTHAIVEQMLKCSYTPLGRSKIDGVKVEGFHTNDPAFGHGIMGNPDVTLWVDIATELPVLMEMAIKTQDKTLRYVTHDFQWDLLVDESLFEPPSLEGYTQIDQGTFKMPAADEDQLIKVLHFLARWSGGYPQQLDMQTMAMQMQSQMPTNKEEAKRLFSELYGLSEESTPEERTQAITKNVMMMQGAALFYASLLQGDQEPAYFGSTVTPADTDKILLRWKVADDQVRIVFGDLKTETVTAARLTELEEGLPTP